MHANNPYTTVDREGGPIAPLAFLSHEPAVLHHDDDRDGEIERVTVDYDGDGKDDLIVCAESCVGVLDFGGDPKSSFHPVTEGYDAGTAGELPLSVTTFAALEPCGTRARLAVWPRATSRAGAVAGLFASWNRPRAVRVLIRQAYSLFVLNRPFANYGGKGMR
jgi:hypothetical protein